MTRVAFSLTITILLMTLASVRYLPGAWGLNHLGYLRPEIGLSLVAMVAVLMLPHIRAALERPVERLYDSLLGVGQSRSAVFWCGTCFAVLCLAFRCSTQLWGDGELLSALAEEAASPDRSVLDGIRIAIAQDKVAPGAATIHAIVGRVGRVLGVDVRTAIAAFHAILGGAWIVVTSRIMARISLHDSTKALLAVCFYGSGAIVLFFGYIEDYTALYLLGSVLALLGVLHHERDVPVVAVVVIALAATTIHVLATLFIPSALYLLFVRGESRRRRSRLLTMIIITATIASAITLASIESLQGHFRPLLGHQSALLSGTYAYSLANLLLLLVPASIVLATVLNTTPTNDWLKPVETAPFRKDLRWVAISPFIVFIGFFLPALGMIRDWDLYALASPFLVIALAPALERRARVIRRWLLPIAGLTLVQTGGWVAVNVSESASLARFESSVRQDPTHGGYAYENLANYYQQRGRKEEEFRAWHTGYREFGNPRYALNAAHVAAESGRLAEAIDLTQKALSGSPENTKARVNLVTYLAEAGDFPEIIVVASEGLRLDPDHPALNMFLGMALFQTRQYSDAYRQLVGCLELDLSPDMRANAEQAIAAIEKARRP